MGVFSFQSAKQERQHNVHQGRCRAHMFAMRVSEELEVWPEGLERQRCWVSQFGGTAAASQTWTSQWH